MSTCSCCGQPLPRDALTERLQAFKQWCAENGRWVSADDRVNEDVAAELLGLAPGTLRNWSYVDQPLPIVRVAKRRTYRLRDLAAFLEK